MSQPCDNNSAIGLPDFSLSHPEGAPSLSLRSLQRQGGAFDLCPCFPILERPEGNVNRSKPSGYSRCFQYPGLRLVWAPLRFECRRKPARGKSEQMGIASAETCEWNERRMPNAVEPRRSAQLRDLLRHRT